MYNYENISPNNTTFPGIYIGVVEDNNDPDKAGKVRVRVVGIHTDKKEQTDEVGIPTNNLPWAIPALPIAEGATSGLGLFSVPVQGSWVTIFFIGGDHNYPVYFASIAGQPQAKPNSSQGFADPAGKYPSYVGEPDWNRNARSGKELIKDSKDNSRVTGVSQYKSGSWDEPSSPYAAKYPNNTVFEIREGGPVLELDGTPGAERFHIYHKKSGNYIEISASGQTVIKSVANNYEINISDKNIVIKGNSNNSIEGDSDTNISGNLAKNVDGNEEVSIGGNKQDIINGNLNVTIMGTANITGQIINLDGGTGALQGVVTGKCMCSFTGAPHPDVSQTVKASF